MIVVISLAKVLSAGCTCEDAACILELVLLPR